MILLADSGGTKTHWCVMDDNGLIEQTFTPGINPYTHTTEQIFSTVQLAFSTLQKCKVSQTLYFYGSGCGTAAQQQIVSNILKKFFNRSVHVEGDLLGAARALCGRHAGLVAILGTGSSSCSFDGTAITSNRPSLGYILGDEGSGSFIGKRLVTDLLYGNMPVKIAETLTGEAALTKENILHALYKMPGGNTFLAGVVRQVLPFTHHAYVQDLISNAFKQFISTHLVKYPHAVHLPIHFTGSIAFYFSDILANCIHHEGLKMGKVLQAPMAGLIDFHKNINQ